MLVFVAHQVSGPVHFLYVDAVILFARRIIGGAPRFLFFFFNDTATTEIYTLSLHDALPIYSVQLVEERDGGAARTQVEPRGVDRKSTRLNSSHDQISDAVFCLKKKKQQHLILLFTKQKKNQTQQMNRVIIP